MSYPHPPFENAKYWTGKRFYRQDEVHINDFYFWDMSGPGAGFENVDIAVGKLAFAYGRTGDTRSDKFTVVAVGPDGTMFPVKVPGMTPPEGNRIVSKYQLHLSQLSTTHGGTLDLSASHRHADVSRTLAVVRRAPDPQRDPST